jgi:hypothetical protein
VSQRAGSPKPNAAPPRTRAARRVYPLAASLAAFPLTIAALGCNAPMSATADARVRAVELPAPPAQEPVGPLPPRASVRGIGIGPFFLGQTEAELISLAGEALTSRSFEDEAEMWRVAGYDPDAEGPFIAGFDHVLEYEQSETAELEGHAPLFKAFVRRGKVVALTFTAFGVRGDAVVSVGLSPCNFLGDEATIEQRFGPAEAIEASGDGFEHLYPTQGVSVIAERGVVLVIHLHEPLGPGDASKVRSRVRPVGEAHDAPGP